MNNNILNKNLNCALFLVLLIQTSVTGQSQTPLENGLLSPSLSKTISEKPVESVWEFGLKLTAPSEARGITATVPIPMAWPEQEIEIVSVLSFDEIGVNTADRQKIIRNFDIL